MIVTLSTTSDWNNYLTVTSGETFYDMNFVAEFYRLEINILFTLMLLLIRFHKQFCRLKPLPKCKIDSWNKVICDCELPVRTQIKSVSFRHCIKWTNHGLTRHHLLIQSCNRQKVQLVFFLLTVLRFKTSRNKTTASPCWNKL